jgi:hypothetical protein
MSIARYRSFAGGGLEQGQKGARLPPCGRMHDSLQKDLEKALNEDGETPAQTNLHKMRARIEIVADFADLKKIVAMLKKIVKKQELTCARI